MPGPSLKRAALCAAALLLAARSWSADETARDVKPLARPEAPALTALSPLAVPLTAVGPQAAALPANLPAPAEPPPLPASAVAAPGATAVAAQAVAPPAAAAEAAAAAPEAKADQPVESLTAAGAIRFDRAAPLAQAQAQTPWRFDEAPDAYRQELAARGAPKVELTRVLSREGSSGVLFEASLGGRKVAVKSYGSTAGEDWPGLLSYFHNEVRMAREMSRVLGPRGMAPKSYGEVDIGARGNPSWAMEIIDGADPELLTASEARRLITPETLRQAARGIEMLKAAGLGGGDSPQPMILQRAQTINGVPRRAGDVVFMDAGGLTQDRRIWKSAEDQAAELAFVRLRADQLYASDPGAAVAGAPALSAVEHAKLIERARKLAQAALAAPRVQKPASSDAGFDEYLRNETGFDLASLTKQGVPPQQIEQMRAAYLRERPPPALDFPDGPPAPGGAGVPGKLNGQLMVRSNGKDRLVTAVLNRKPDAMEATFLGLDGQADGIAIKTAQYVSVEPKKEAQAQAALRAEAAALRAAAGASRKAGFPKNVSVPEVLGLGFMDPSLAAGIYGKPQRVPILLMRRAKGVTVENWLNSGRRLDGPSFAGLIDAVRRIHESGLAHGDLNMGNILVSEDAATGRQSFVLIDFGASKSRDQVDSDLWSAMIRDDQKSLAEIAGFFRKKGRLAGSL